MKIKRVFYFLLIITIIAAVALILTSKEPTNKMAGDNTVTPTPAEDVNSTGQPTSAPESADGQITEPTVETVTVPLPEISRLILMVATLFPSMRKRKCWVIQNLHSGIFSARI